MLKVSLHVNKDNKFSLTVEDDQDNKKSEKNLAAEDLTKALEETLNFVDQNEDLSLNIVLNNEMNLEEETERLLSLLNECTAFKAFQIERKILVENAQKSELEKTANEIAARNRLMQHLNFKPLVGGGRNINEQFFSYLVNNHMHTLHRSGHSIYSTMAYFTSILKEFPDIENRSRHEVKKDEIIIEMQKMQRLGLKAFLDHAYKTAQATGSDIFYESFNYNIHYDLISEGLSFAEFTAICLEMNDRYKISLPFKSGDFIFKDFFGPVKFDDAFQDTLISFLTANRHLEFIIFGLDSLDWTEAQYKSFEAKLVSNKITTRLEFNETTKLDKEKSKTKKSDIISLYPHKLIFAEYKISLVTDFPESEHMEANVIYIKMNKKDSNFTFSTKEMSGEERCVTSSDILNSMGLHEKYLNSEGKMPSEVSKFVSIKDNSEMNSYRKMIINTTSAVMHRSLKDRMNNVIARTKQDLYNELITLPDKQEVKVTPVKIPVYISPKTWENPRPDIFSHASNAPVVQYQQDVNTDKELETQVEEEQGEAQDKKTDMRVNYAAKQEALVNTWQAIQQQEEEQQEESEVGNEGLGDIPFGLLYDETNLINLKQDHLPEDIRNMLSSGEHQSKKFFLDFWNKISCKESIKYFDKATKGAIAEMLHFHYVFVNGFFFDFKKNTFHDNLPDGFFIYTNPETKERILCYDAHVLNKKKTPFTPSLTINAVTSAVNKDVGADKIAALPKSDVAIFKKHLAILKDSRELGSVNDLVEVLVVLLPEFKDQIKEIYAKDLEQIWSLELKQYFSILLQSKGEKSALLFLDKLNKMKNVSVSLFKGFAEAFMHERFYSKVTPDLSSPEANAAIDRLCKFSEEQITWWNHFALQKAKLAINDINVIHLVNQFEYFFQQLQEARPDFVKLPAECHVDGVANTGVILERLLAMAKRVIDPYTMFSHLEKGVSLDADTGYAAVMKDGFHILLKEMQLSFSTAEIPFPVSYKVSIEGLFSTLERGYEFKFIKRNEKINSDEMASQIFYCYTEEKDQSKICYKFKNKEGMVIEGHFDAQSDEIIFGSKEDFNKRKEQIESNQINEDTRKRINQFFKKTHGIDVFNSAPMIKSDYEHFKMRVDKREDAEAEAKLSHILNQEQIYRYIGPQLFHYDIEDIRLIHNYIVRSDLSVRDKSKFFTIFMVVGTEKRSLIHDPEPIISDIIQLLKANQPTEKMLMDYATQIVKAATVNKANELNADKSDVPHFEIVKPDIIELSLIFTSLSKQDLKNFPLNRVVEIISTYRHGALQALINRGMNKCNHAIDNDFCHLIDQVAAKVESFNIPVFKDQQGLELKKTDLITKIIASLGSIDFNAMKPDELIALIGRFLPDQAKKLEKLVEIIAEVDVVQSEVIPNKEIFITVLESNENIRSLIMDTYPGIVFKGAANQNCMEDCRDLVIKVATHFKGNIQNLFDTVNQKLSFITVGNFKVSDLLNIDDIIKSIDDLIQQTKDKNQPVRIGPFLELIKNIDAFIEDFKKNIKKVEGIPGMSVIKEVLPSIINFMTGYVINEITNACKLFVNASFAALSEELKENHKISIQNGKLTTELEKYLGSLKDLKSIDDYTRKYNVISRLNEKIKGLRRNEPLEFKNLIDSFSKELGKIKEDGNKEEWIKKATAIFSIDILTIQQKNKFMNQLINMDHDISHELINHIINNSANPEMLKLALDIINKIENTKEVKIEALNAQASQASKLIQDVQIYHAKFDSIEFTTTVFNKFVNFNDVVKLFDKIKIAHDTLSVDAFNHFIKITQILLIPHSGKNADENAKFTELLEHLLNADPSSNYIENIASLFHFKPYPTFNFLYDKVKNKIDFSEISQEFNQIRFGDRLNEKQELDLLEINKLNHLQDKIKNIENLSEDQNLSMDEQKELTDELVKINGFGQELLSYSDKDLRFLLEEIKKGRVDEESFYHRLLKTQGLEGASVDKRMVLLAVLREVFFRTYHEANAPEKQLFANNTQMMAVWHALKVGGNIVSGIDTGQGKTLICSLQAAALWFQGDTVDICSSDFLLAKRDLEHVENFYKFIGAETAFISADTPLDAYKTNGINYSDVPNLALFRARRIQAGMDDKEFRTSLILDEADHTILDDTSEYILSDSKGNAFDPFGNEYRWVYRLVNQFTDYLDKNYLSTQDLSREMINDIESCFPKDGKKVLTINDEVQALWYYLKRHAKGDQENILHDPEIMFKLNTWIDSSKMSRKFKKDIHFRVAERTIKLGNKETVKYSTAVILEGGFPKDKASWSNGVQQCLHARLDLENQKLAKQRKQKLNEHKIKTSPTSANAADRYIPFSCFPESQSVSITNAKNFIDYYAKRKNPGRVMGNTATLGSVAERHEMHQNYNFKLYKYPPHQPSKRVVLAPVYSKTFKDQVAKLRTAIISSDRPVLILCPDIPTVRAIENLLAGKDQNKNKKYLLPGNKKVQIFTAEDLDDNSNVKDTILSNAGKANYVTLSTISGRGTDITPKDGYTMTLHSDGVIKDDKINPYTVYVYLENGKLKYAAKNAAGKVKRYSFGNNIDANMVNTIKQKVHSKESTITWGRPNPRKMLDAYERDILFQLTAKKGFSPSKGLLVIDTTLHSYRVAVQGEGRSGRQGVVGEALHTYNDEDLKQRFKVEKGLTILKKGKDREKVIQQVQKSLDDKLKYARLMKQRVGDITHIMEKRVQKAIYLIVKYDKDADIDRLKKTQQHILERLQSDLRDIALEENYNIGHDSKHPVYALQRINYETSRYLEQAEEIWNQAGKDLINRIPEEAITEDRDKKKMKNLHSFNSQETNAFAAILKNHQKYQPKSLREEMTEKSEKAKEDVKYKKYLDGNDFQLVTYSEKLHSSEFSLVRLKNLFAYKEEKTQELFAASVSFAKKELNHYMKNFWISGDRQASVRDLRFDLEELEKSSAKEKEYKEKFIDLLGKINDKISFSLKGDIENHPSRTADSRYRTMLVNVKNWILATCPPSLLDNVHKKEMQILLKNLEQENKRKYYKSSGSLNKMLAHLIAFLGKQDETEDKTAQLAHAIASLREIKAHPDFDESKSSIPQLDSHLNHLFEIQFSKLPYHEAQFYRAFYGLETLLTKIKIKEPERTSLFGKRDYLREIPKNNLFKEQLSMAENIDARGQYHLYFVMSNIRNYLAENYGSHNITFEIEKTDGKPAAVHVGFDILNPFTGEEKKYSLKVDIHNIELAKFVPLLQPEKEKWQPIVSHKEGEMVVGSQPSIIKI